MKEFLSRRGIQFTERNVDRDREALDEFLQAGLSYTPTTVIDGKDFQGFNRRQLERALAS